MSYNWWDIIRENGNTNLILVKASIITFDFAIPKWAATMLTPINFSICTSFNCLILSIKHAMFYIITHVQVFNTLTNDHRFTCEFRTTKNLDLHLQCFSGAVRLTITDLRSIDTLTWGWAGHFQRNTSEQFPWLVTHPLDLSEAHMPQLINGTRKTQSTKGCR